MPTLKRSKRSLPPWSNNHASWNAMTCWRRAERPTAASDIAKLSHHSRVRIAPVQVSIDLHDHLQGLMSDDARDFDGIHAVASRRPPQGDGDKAVSEQVRVDVLGSRLADVHLAGEVAHHLPQPVVGEGFVA